MSGMFDDLMDAPAVEAVKDTDGQPDSNTADDTVKTVVATADDKSDKTETEPRKTVQVESLDNLPAGFVSVKGFAWALTQRNLESAVKENRTPGPEDMVDTQAVYAATRGKRWSLFALEAVTAEGTNLGLVIPLSEGLEAWDTRPERGTGGTVTMTPERRETRILRAGKFKAQFDKMQKRYPRITQLLNEVGATWADADEAYNTWLETEDGKKEIADSNKNGNGDNGNDE